ncbi:MAG: N-acetyltransferase family protein [Flavobacteriales bacterium]
MKIIPVRKEDLPKLQEISRQTFYDTFAEVNTAEDMQHYLDVNLSEMQLLKEWKNPQTAFYFACQEEEILGYLKLNEGEAQTESRKETSLEIERIYVRSSHQRRGIGQFLLDQAIQIAKAKGLKLIWLGVWEHNLSAIRFYERNGFEFFGKHVFMLGTDEQTDLLLERKLD